MYHQLNPSQTTTSYLYHDNHAISHNSTIHHKKIEILYSTESSILTMENLPTLLQQQAKQPRWQLWLTPQLRLNQQWLHHMNLPKNKIIHNPHLDSIQSIQAMEKALISGNFSLVLAFLPYISLETQQRLKESANHHCASVIILKEEEDYFH